MSNWSQTPIITVTVATCPHCRCTRFDPCWSVSNGDGSRTRFARCRDCGERLRIVVEPADIDDVIFPDSGIH